jgi:hypothetical protein
MQQPIALKHKSELFKKKRVLSADKTRFFGVGEGVTLLPLEFNAFVDF